MADLSILSFKILDLNWFGQKVDDQPLGRRSTAKVTPWDTMAQDVSQSFSVRQNALGTLPASRDIVSHQLCHYVTCHLAGMPAYNVMKAKEHAKEISLESNVGLCGLKISASINEDKLAAKAQKILGYAIWHEVASAIHSGGKKALFNAKSPFSDALGIMAKEKGEKVLNEFFDDVKIEAFAFEKASPESKFLAFCKNLGLDPEKSRAAWEQANSKAEELAEPIE